MIDKKWIFKDFDRDKVAYIAKCFGVSPLVAVTLYNRGIVEEEQIKKFLECKTGSLYDPFLMKDMDKAVSRVKAAIAVGEKITIYGDYDVDGITSVVILYKGLKSVGADVDYYIPNRIEDGYGVCCAAIDQIKRRGTGLIVTVDVGVTARDEVEYAKGVGIDMVITDHHECKDILPDACAVIDPKREDCDYPFKALAGVGVAFKFLQALNSDVSLDYLLGEYADLVALGTVADIAPLIDENRIFVSLGLQKFRQTKNIGLRALMDISVPGHRAITSTVIGYNIAPKINASGRLGRTEISVNLFLAEDCDEALELAKLLSEDNLVRQQTEQRMLAQALEYIDNNKSILNNSVLVIPHEDWNQGIVGIVSSRITERFYKPSLLFAVSGQFARGSGRGIAGFNLFKALESVSDVLEKYGGHELAAGFTIRTEKIPELEERINEYSDQYLTDQICVPVVNIDAKIKAQYINMAIVNELDVLQPFGVGNAKPVFAIMKTRIVKISVMCQGKHLRLTLQKDSKYFEAIGFEIGNYGSSFKINDLVDVAFSLDINNYKQERYVQLTIKHIIKSI